MKALNDSGNLVDSVKHTTIASQHEGLVSLTTQAFADPAYRAC